MAMLLAVSMTAGPVFAGNTHEGKKDDDGKGKVVCLVEHKVGKSGKHEVIKVPKYKAKEHEKHGDKVIKCFKEKKDKDKGKDDKGKDQDKPKKGKDDKPKKDKPKKDKSKKGNKNKGNKDRTPAAVKKAPKVCKPNGARFVKMGSTPDYRVVGRGISGVLKPAGVGACDIRGTGYAYTPAGVTGG